MSRNKGAKLSQKVLEKIGIVREMAGKHAPEDIADAVGWTEGSLRSRASHAGISLRFAGSKERMKRKYIGHQNKRQTLVAALAIDRLWKVPKRCFHQAHMGNFT